MKRLYLNLALSLFCIQAVAQDCYCLVENVGNNSTNLVITNLKGAIKKITPISYHHDTNNNAFAIAGYGDKIVCAGNEDTNPNLEKIKACFWMLDLNGDVLSQHFVGKNRDSELTSITSLCAERNLLFFAGIHEGEANNYGLFIVSDAQGTTLFELSLHDINPENETEFFSIVTSQDYIYIVGDTLEGDNSYATLWKFDYNYNLISSKYLGSNASKALTIKQIQDKLYICGTDNLNGALWQLDLEGNVIDEYQYLPSQNMLASLDTIISWKNKWYISSFEKDQNGDITNTFFLITTNQGALIEKLPLSTAGSDALSVPLARYGSNFFLGMSFINDSQQTELPDLVILDADGSVRSQNIFNLGGDEAYFMDIYIPNFDFLYKALSEFKPVKYQKGL